MITEGTRFRAAHNVDFDRLSEELRSALGNVSKKDLQGWGLGCGKVFKDGLVRRGVGLAGLGKKVVETTLRETKDAVKATAQKRLKTHLTERGTSGAQAMGELTKNGASELKAFMKLLKSKPGEAAPLLLGGVLGFAAGSGGLDGDGGVPDLDLLGGIGSHRSIFTHSVIGGAALETAILGAASLTMLVYSELPEDHHSLWDVLHTFGQRTAGAAAVGGAAGVAYHLSVDSTVDGFTPYKDLPFSASMMDHKAIMGLNAIGEWMGRKKR